MITEKQILGMTKDQRIRSAYAELKKGKRIAFVPDNDTPQRRCVCELKRGISPKGNIVQYIYWNRHGEARSNCTLQDLKWIAREIGDCTTYNFQIIGDNYWARPRNEYVKRMVLK